MCDGNLLQLRCFELHLVSTSHERVTIFHLDDCNVYRTSILNDEKGNWLRAASKTARDKRISKKYLEFL